ncbi:MAG: ATPase, T2SS/T4P/T4SS family [Mariprofundaceae bacterium]
MNKLHFVGSNDHSYKLSIEDVVYIAMHHHVGEGLGVKSDHKQDILKITTVNLESFCVVASPVMSNTSGFFAQPQNDAVFERIFFYSHGIRLQEKPERLGDLLLEQKKLNPEDLEYALNLQKESSVSLGDVLKEQGKISDKDMNLALQQQQDQRMRLGDLLIKNNLTSQADVEEALEDQKGDTDLPLGSILLDKGKIEVDELHSALEVQNRRKMRLGEILVEAELISEKDLQKALDEQKERGLRLGEILLNSHIVTEEQLLDALAGKFHLPTVNLDEYDINPLAVAMVDRSIIEKYKVFPIDADKNSITIALSDPMGLDAYDGVCFKTGKKVHEVMAIGSQLKIKIEDFLKEKYVDDSLACEFLYQDNEEDEDDLSEFEISQSVEDAPVVRLVNRIINNALIKKASDIHILPQAKKITLAYRLNGQLLGENELDKSLHKKISARIKILCGMDIAEQRLPQDGRLILHDGPKKYEFRVSCIPNAFGESLVLRVLNKDAAVDLEKLGLRKNDLEKLSVIARKPYGLLLVTGPTGSGKSTTLFSILKSISHLPAHILTIEDPIESEIDGANQIQVNHKIGMTFARVLRNVLRHDPDIIMIGEMRDEETAEIGVEAALTGHLMLSTLHTNSAVDTIIRLNDLKVPNYLIAPSLLGVVSQNLIKTLCSNCKQVIDKNDEVFRTIDELGYERPKELFTAAGCNECNDTGYDGRVMLYEFLAVNEAVRQAIHNGVTGHALQKIAIENGMVPKSTYALQLAADGRIDYHDFIYSLMS